MLEVNKVSVAYSGVHAVRELSIEVPEGKLTALIGSNGAGKTSLLKAISGLVHTDSGTVTFGGEDITNARPDKIVDHGLIHCPEGRRIFPTLSVEENLRVGGHLHRREISTRMKRVYSIFPRLDERRKQYGQSLSGGEQQMLAIGRAMMAGPRMLLLDEPSLGLAPVAIEAVFEAIERLRDDGATVLLVEQNAHISLAAADYAYVVERGSVRLEGPASELAESDEVRRAYLGA